MQTVREQGLADAFASGFGREAEVDEFSVRAVGCHVHQTDAVHAAAYAK